MNMWAREFSGYPSEFGTCWNHKFPTIHDHSLPFRHRFTSSQVWGMPSDIKLADVMALHKVKPKIGQKPSMKQPLHQLMLVPAMVIGNWNRRSRAKRKVILQLLCWLDGIQKAKTSDTHITSKKHESKLIGTLNPTNVFPPGCFFLQRLPSEDEFMTIAYSLSGLKLTREELQEDYEHLSSQQSNSCKRIQRPWLESLTRILNLEGRGEDMFTWIAFWQPVKAWNETSFRWLGKFDPWTILTYPTCAPWLNSQLSVAVDVVLVGCQRVKTLIPQVDAHVDSFWSKRPANELKVLDWDLQGILGPNSCVFFTWFWDDVPKV